MLVRFAIATYGPIRNAFPMNFENYQSYRDIPSIAGIASMEEAAKIGYSVDECVDRLKRHHWCFKRLHEIFLSRIADEPIFELKSAYSLHAYYCADHAAAWRKRVGEMREPPLGLDRSPSEALDILLDELLAAPNTAELLEGVYGLLIPELRRSVEAHRDSTNRLVDHPSFRICRFALIELEEMDAFGSKAIASLKGGDEAEPSAWFLNLKELLAIAGGLDGSVEPLASEVKRVASSTPFEYKREPQRDERFKDTFNMGVHAEAFLYDERFEPDAKTLMMYYKRLREIDVPEMMASIIVETKDKPWSYYVDMTRQLWDEARHALMGEVGFVRAGIDWSKYVRVNKTWSLALNTQLTPIERHAVLYFIEQGLMPKTGKRYEWEVGVASTDPFSGMIQDYDWADEVLHARIGRDWYVSQRESPQEAIEYGDASWSKVLIDWSKYQDDGLTEHANWWPTLYKEWCRIKGIEPNEEALEFNTSYQEARADLKEISVSG